MNFNFNEFTLTENKRIIEDINHASVLLKNLFQFTKQVSNLGLQICISP